MRSARRPGNMMRGASTVLFMTDEDKSSKQRSGKKDAFSHGHRLIAPDQKPPQRPAPQPPKPDKK